MDSHNQFEVWELKSTPYFFLTRDLKENQVDLDQKDQLVFQVSLEVLDQWANMDLW